MSDIKKILIVRLSAIGDTIHTLPVAWALKKHYPDCEIGWVVENKAKMFVENNPFIDKCFVIDKKRKNLFKIIKKIRKEKYDIALDTQQLFKSGIILGLCGAKRRITLSGGREFSQFFANKIVKAKKALFDKDYHVIKRNLELCEYLGCKVEEIHFPMPKVSKEVEEYINELMPKNNLPNVVLAPATTWRNKHLPNEFWTEIADFLENRANVICTGSIKDEKLINHIKEYSKNKNIINYAGKTDLLELKELYSKCKLVITPDSGSAHIAWACEKPCVITLFCATSAKRTGPFDNDSRNSRKYFSVQSSANCSPCMKKSCINKEKEICEKGFDINIIKGYINEILK